MKKIILSMFSAVFLFSCSDTGIEVVSYADYSSDISYQVSLKPSPKRLYPKAVSTMAIPGKRESHHALIILF